jgi:hypothetical protein
MKLRSKRLTSIGTAALLLSVAFAVSGPSPSRRSFLPFGQTVHAQSQVQTARPQMSEAAFKNIQVLKGIPVDEFMGTMGLFSAALSVCCGDCHTGAGTSDPKWEADPPRKTVARRMITMVNAINKEHFNGRPVITCWTCHRGAQSPASTPPIDTIYTNTPVFVPPDILPAAPASAGAVPVEQVFDKYIQALGGADRLSKLTSYVAKGTSQLFGEVNAEPVEIYAKAPSLAATFVHQRGGDLARTWDGRDAWVMLPLTVVEEFPLTASMREGARLEAQLAFPGGIKAFFKNWRATYPATLDGHDVYVIQGTDSNGLVATFYFDKQTGLLTRVVRYANSAVGRVPTQYDYSDYRPVAGVMMPYKFTYGWLSGREEYVLSEIQPNVPVDASKFGKPVQRPK